MLLCAADIAMLMNLCMLPGLALFIPLKKVLISDGNPNNTVASGLSHASHCCISAQRTPVFTWYKHGVYARTLNNRLLDCISCQQQRINFGFRHMGPPDKHTLVHQRCNAAKEMPVSESLPLRPTNHIFQKTEHQPLDVILRFAQPTLICRFLMCTQSAVPSSTNKQCKKKINFPPCPPQTVKPTL